MHSTEKMHKSVSQNNLEVVYFIDAQISTKNAIVVAESLLHLLSERTLKWNGIPAEWKWNLLICTFISHK